MGLDLSASAFAPWVDQFVTASNALSGISRAPTPGEVAAHRGFFARRHVGASNLLVLQAHLGYAGEAMPDEDVHEAERLPAIAALLRAELSPSQLHVAFGDLSPFRRANRRCARALWMSRRLEQGYRPEPDRSARDWERLFPAQGRPAAPRVSAPSDRSGLPFGPH